MAEISRASGPTSRSSGGAAPIRCSCCAERLGADESPQAAARPDRVSVGSIWATFWAMLVRDLTVLDRTLKEFLPRTVMQPLLLMFVFTYVFPRIGQGVGGQSGAAAFSAQLVAGVVALSVVLQGVQAVALPLVRDFSVVKEIEDRVLAPIPIWMVAVEKMAVGSLQSLLAAGIVFPVAAAVPATAVSFRVDWVALALVTVLSCTTSAALGLTFGTLFKPGSVPLLISAILLPLTFLGAVYYPWAQLTPIPWLKYAVLVNPLVYMSEGFRAALLDGVPHMSVPAVYAALFGFSVVLMVVGIKGFNRRVLS